MKQRFETIQRELVADDLACFPLDTLNSPHSTTIIRYMIHYFPLTPLYPYLDPCPHTYGRTYILLACARNDSIIHPLPLVYNPFTCLAYPHLFPHPVSILTHCSILSPFNHTLHRFITTYTAFHFNSGPDKSHHHEKSTLPFDFAINPRSRRYLTLSVPTSKSTINQTQTTNLRRSTIYLQPASSGSDI